MANPIKIDIWSDIACPWCYIGKRRLETALKDFDGAPVEIEYHSFQLNPAAPADYKGTHDEYLTGHLGASMDQVRGMNRQITGLARDEGLDYRLDDIKVTNTGKAHELIHFAAAQGKGPEMKERLLRAYFTEGRHVGHDADLADLAAEIGLDRDAALAALTKGSYRQAVADDKAQGAAIGVQGVPFFVVDGKYAISGAQPAELFLQALNKVQSERAGAGA
ncbi:DsbA family oxidoreductase [Paracoccus pacificus]|uniref:DsbA family protein n=1 Tax=Paracoccus pacificus TaxID=1463598 RepID=A0ABW4RAJ0_9RHOB